MRQSLLTGRAEERAADAVSLRLGMDRDAQQLTLARHDAQQCADRPR